jgi:hypothetical protein
MYSSLTHSLPHPANKGRNRKLLIAGALVLSGIVLVALILVLKWQNREAKPVQAPAKRPAAELISATGAAFVKVPGGTDWRPVQVGARLMEGDLLQTDSLGEASIRYSNGVTVSIQARTIFTVHNAGDGSMEISVPSQEALAPSVASMSYPEAGTQTALQSPKKPEIPVLKDTKANQTSLFIKIDHIIPFGRSLELVGTVEAGSKLAVNDGIVDVAGDGFFKHFTNPFPVTAQKVRLVMKVTDLAGRTRTVTTTYDFYSQDGND